MIIESGMGNGVLAGVTKDNRLMTESINITQMAAASDEGKAFLIATDFIALTTTSDYSGILYIKNTTSDKDYYIQSVRTCGSMVQYWKAYRNVTTGTLITSGTPATISNGKFGTEFITPGSFLKGANALTITNGALIGTHIQGANMHSVQDFEGGLELSPGTSIAYSVKPSASGDVCMQVLLFVKDHS